jgi:DNA-binding transcriptional LysR family regulator
MRVVMEFDNIETIKRAIEIDAGVALLPEPTVDREVQAGTLVAKPLQGTRLSRPVGIVVRNNKDLGALVKLFIQMLRQPIGGPAAGQPLPPNSSYPAGVAHGAPSVRHKRLRRKRPAGA